MNETPRFDKENVPQILRAKISMDDVQRLKSEPTRIKALGLYLTPDCNMNCRTELTTERRLKIIDEAHEAGADQLIISGAGEPLLDDGLWTVLGHAESIGMHTLLYTNSTLVDKETAKRFFSFPHLSINSKKYSFNKDICNYVFGGDYFDDVEAGLQNLMDAGFNKTDPSRLGVQCTILNLNLAEIPDILRWVRKNNIVPQFNRIFYAGRATRPEIAKWDVTNEEYAKLAAELQRIDEEEFGIKWPEYWRIKSPILGGNCVRPSYWVAIDESGNVKGCNVEPGFGLGDVKNSSLTDFLIKQQDLIKAMRENFEFNDCLMSRAAPPNPAKQ